MSRAALLLRAGKKCIGVGKNYAKHIEEMAHTHGVNKDVVSKAAKKDPVLFLMPTTSYAFPEDPALRIPKGIGEVHHELELGVVIGRTCKNVPRDEWRDVVAGYVLALDMTARDLQQQAKDRGLPWSVSKGMDTFLPLSHVIDATEIDKPDDLEMWLNVNGQRKMTAKLSNMIHDIPSLIVHISSKFTLEAGDLIVTGTPDGVGAVNVGDIMEAGVVGFPQLSITCPVEDDK